MAQLHHIKTAGKRYSCVVCKQPIIIGEPYKYFTPYLSIRRYANETCRIPFTTSNKAHVITYVPQQEYNYRTSQLCLWMANRW